MVRRTGRASAVSVPPRASDRCGCRPWRWRCTCTGASGVAGAGRRRPSSAQRGRAKGRPPPRPPAKGSPTADASVTSAVGRPKSLQWSRRRRTRSIWACAVEGIAERRRLVVHRLVQRAQLRSTGATSDAAAFSASATATTRASCCAWSSEAGKLSPPSRRRAPQGPPGDGRQRASTPRGL